MTGRVFLVGAGPGDPELLTVRATRLLEQADAVVYDRLVSPAILDLIPDGVLRIDVGKSPQHHPVPQDEINSTLVTLANAGRDVVRLKGGDPLMFGRGGEEALSLKAAGIPYEIVPGITAAQGTAASTTVPLTHRGIASSVRYLTGHCRAGIDLDFDWPGLADPDTTLVVYMGLANIREISGELIAHGRSPRTPVLAVADATRPTESRLHSTLQDIAGDVEGAGLGSPILFIVGEVVALARQQDGARYGAQIDQMVAAQ